MVCFTSTDDSRVGLVAAEIAHVSQHRDAVDVTHIKMRDGSYFFVRGRADQVISHLSELCTGVES
jgi:hypothetical protein